MAAAEAFWAGVVGVPVEQLGPDHPQEPQPLTVRKNVNEDYHGCLCVSVRRSTDLNVRISGWFEAIAAGAGTVGHWSGVV